MIKFVIFDWSGIPFSNTQTVAESDNQVLKVFGCKPVDLKQWRGTAEIPAKVF